MTNIVNFPKAAKAKITYRPAIKIDAEKIGYPYSVIDLTKKTKLENTSLS